MQGAAAPHDTSHDVGPPPGTRRGLTPQLSCEGPRGSLPEDYVAIPTGATISNPQHLVGFSATLAGQRSNLKGFAFPRPVASRLVVVVHTPRPHVDEAVEVGGPFVALRRSLRLRRGQAAEVVVVVHRIHSNVPGSAAAAASYKSQPGVPLADVVERLEEVGGCRAEGDANALAPVGAETGGSHLLGTRCAVAG